MAAPAREPRRTGVANKPDDLDVERLVVPAPSAIRLPMTRSVRLNFRANASFTTATFGDPFGVCVGEFPSGNERDAERAKVIHAHSCGGRVGVHAGAGLEAFDRHVIAPAALRKNRNGGRGHGCDARHRTKLGVKPIEELPVVVRCVAVQAWRETECHQALTLDTQFHAQRVHQADDEQAGNGEQPRRERQLRDGHRRAKARRCSGARGSSAMRVHTAHERRAHGMQCREESERDARRQSKHEREREQACVEVQPGERDHPLGGSRAWR